MGSTVTILSNSASSFGIIRIHVLRIIFLGRSVSLSWGDVSIVGGDECSNVAF